MYTHSCLTLCDPCQAPLCMEFSRQEYWGGLPLPPTEDLPDPGIEPKSPAFQAGSSLFNHQCCVRNSQSLMPLDRWRKQRLREVTLLSWGWSQHVNPKLGPWTSGCPNSQWEGLQVIFLCILPTCEGFFFFLHMFRALHNFSYFTNDLHLSQWHSSLKQKVTTLL